MATIADDIAAISTDSTKLATDQAAVATAQQALTAAQAVVDGDNQTITAADTTLSNALKAAGVPAVIKNNDGSFSIYAYSPDLPGFTITLAQDAGGLPG